MKYKEVKAKVLHDDADMVSYLMMCAGSDGVSINDGADIREVINSEKNWDYYDPALGNADTTYATVIGCFDENADIDELCSEINETARHAEISVGINDSDRFRQTRRRSQVVGRGIRQAKGIDRPRYGVRYGRA